MPARLLKLLTLWLCLAAAPTLAAERWQPPQNAVLSVIFTNVPSADDELLAIVGNADIVDLDAFNARASTITALQAKGKKVVCYLNFGAWEDWRPDGEDFPAAVIGNSYRGWAGEFWLDIRQVDTLGKLFLPRMQMAKDKGCDGIDSDNLNGYQNQTGFPLTANDQIRFNLAIADLAHGLGMPIGMKNGSGIAARMVDAFDWVTTEGCYADQACGTYAPFVNAHKAVFDLEYDNARYWTEDLCPEATRHGISAMMVNLELDGWREACNPPLSEVEKFFDWAEGQYPELFSRQHPPTASFAGYTFRCYEDRDSCLGIRGSHVFYLIRPDQLFDVGELSQYWKY